MYTNVRLDEVQKKLEKLNNPYLKQLKYTWIEDKPFENYDGVNMSVEKNTGDTLRIRQLKKVGKDGSGTYLYCGYIYNASNEKDAEIKDLEKNAVPVCFESYKKLEDIAKDNNLNEIKAVLQLLSEPKNFEKFKTVRYIGHLYTKTKTNEKGEKEEKLKISRYLVSDSPAIQKQIEKLQKEYAQKNNKDSNSKRIVETDAR